MSEREKDDRVRREQRRFAMAARFLKPLVPANCCQKRDCSAESPLRISEPRLLDAWLELREKIPCFDARDPDIFSDPRFAAVSSDTFMLAQQSVIDEWSRQLSNGAAWLRGTAPRIDALHHPLFVRRVSVSDSARVHLIGDIHSSLASLLNVLANLREKENAFASSFRLAKDHHIVFLGDIVDRGPYSTEVLFLVLMLVLVNPQRVFLINGNHEDCETFSKYGFDRELRARFGQQWFHAKNVLNYLPSALILTRGSRSIQLCHGALTEHLEEQQTMAELVRSTDKQVQFAYLRDFIVNSLCAPREKRSVDNLKWGDFNGSIADLGLSKRDDFVGQVCEFGYRYTDAYLRMLNLDAIISGHQDLSNFTLLVNPRSASEEITRRTEPDVNYPTLRRLRVQKRRFVEEVLQPGVDFLAANTSTAVQSKGNRGLQFDCYLTLF